MSAETKFKVGDRVRVVLEGEVGMVDGAGFYLESADTSIDSLWISPKRRQADVVSIEKIEPPAIVFRVGDRIKSKGAGFELTLADDGYLQHLTSGKVQFYKYGTEKFTSERFELVYPS